MAAQNISAGASLPKDDSVFIRLGRRLRAAARDLALWYWDLGSMAMRALHVLVLAAATVALYLWQREPRPSLALVALIGGTLVILVSTVWLNITYNREYRGSFDTAFQEYVARRVSRLKKADFIPGTNPYGATGDIAMLTRMMRDALHLEVEHVHQLRGNVASSIYGMLVIGPALSGKQSTLWDAMATELKGWTFVQWPHHMDHPKDLAHLLGHRVVL
jgi:hypothetical protein